MPLYSVACAQCGAEQDIFRRFKDYDDTPECCGARMHRQVSAPHVMTDIQPYRSMVTGKMVTSRSEHRSILKSHKLIEVGDQTHHLKPKSLTPPPGLKETLIRVVNEKIRR